MFYLLIGSGLHIDMSAREPVSMEGYLEEGWLGLSSEVEGRILASSVTRDLLCLERLHPSDLSVCQSISVVSEDTIAVSSLGESIGSTS